MMDSNEDTNKNKLARALIQLGMQDLFKERAQKKGPEIQF